MPAANTPRPRLLTRLGVASAALALLLSGCVPPGLQAKKGGNYKPDAPASAAPNAGSGQPGDERETVKAGKSAALQVAGDPATLPAYSAFYKQQPDWKKCEGESEFLCAKVKVPLRWDAPDQDTIELAVLKVPARGERKGSILVNPGGPGGSGVEFAAQAANTGFSADIRDAFDIVGFDPRGVSASSPVDCVDDAELDKLLSDEEAEPVSDEKGTLDETEFAETREKAKDYAKKCQQRSGKILGYLDTWSAARDLDVLRAAVGSEKLDYLGYSYGTYLGASYAELYPQRAGRMVLDGALDPNVSSAQLTEAQLAGFEDSLRRYVKHCQANADCPLTGSVEDGMKQISDFLERSETAPLTGKDGRKLTLPLALTAVILPLYSDSSWPFLTQALQGAFKGDPALMFYLADLGNSRNPDGSFKDNSKEAIGAINCLDHPVMARKEDMDAQSKKMVKEHPYLGRYFVYGSLGCLDWPVAPVREPAPIHAKGTGPILVIGTTHDPATPYAWAVAMHKQLENSRLITFEGDGHTAYGRSGGCVEKVVDRFFLTGQAPDGDVRCDGKGQQQNG
ncbi:alpha/beta hydrolase [Dermabacteraceae bacterium TAE3-ERU27]|nr:alpha/beta hydrolase [Dermabacteraceae bacterium TAE3-ERU27]